MANYANIILVSFCIGLSGIFINQIGNYVDFDYVVDKLPANVKSLYSGMLSSYLKFRNVGDKKVVEEMIFTPQELAKCNGEDGNPLYIGFIGKVYNVEKGRQFYGKGGGYNFFSGRDGSRAFLTGDFTEEGLVDNIVDTNLNDMASIRKWIEFYEKDYEYVGKVVGSYYDENGNEKANLKLLWEKILKAEKMEEWNKEEKKIFPPCNSEWSSDKGGRVWCTTLSGGISRNWIGAPRKYHQPASGNSRCVCVRNTGPPTGWANGQGKDSHSNRGDLDNPNLREYPNCNPKSDSCTFKD